MLQDEELVAEELQRQWVWVPGWRDESADSAARLAMFTRRFTLDDDVDVTAVMHMTADTRYKLWVNGKRVTVGPTRSCSQIWYYDTLDVASLLKAGENEIVIEVLRFFPAARAGFGFARTRLPGLAVYGSVVDTGVDIDLGTATSAWTCRQRHEVAFPMGLKDDYFLHVYERVATISAPPVTSVPRAYNINTKTGEATPWNLAPRIIPFPAESECIVQRVVRAGSTASSSQWSAFLRGEQPMVLPPNSSHVVELEASCHSTAFLRWVFRRPTHGGSRFSVTYAESYEAEPIDYPWRRRKGDRQDYSGVLLGPSDVITIGSAPDDDTLLTYEPFWFRTFRFLRWEIDTGASGLVIDSFQATQVNYPLDAVAEWHERGSDSEQIWDVSVRTLRNCMFDGYADCPFYEQLQYAEDTRSSGLFHYLVSGDDRLMRQAIVGFAASMLPDGLVQSRYPSHVPQVIPGFALFWVLQVCDHHLFFNDASFSRRFLPHILRVFNFFESHIDARGLVSGLPRRYWQFVDWTPEWAPTPGYDGGVPTPGRTTNTHSFITMLYAWVLSQAADLARHIAPSSVDEFATRAARLRTAINTHCYDGEFYRDSTMDAGGSLSQHAQVFAVLCGAATGERASRILLESFHLLASPRPSPTFAPCSYVMTHYAFRAFARAGPRAYAAFWTSAWDPWRAMLAKNLSTWEEDGVTQRSDCHAWGSVALYEYLVELAGVSPAKPGWSALRFAPRLELSDGIEATVPLGRDNVATVTWETRGRDTHVRLRLARAVEVVSCVGGKEVEHGVVERVQVVHRRAQVDSGL